jgi:predicted PurR-regulated permease PerM
MHKVEISYKTIIFSILFLLGLYVVWRSLDLLYSLFIAFILMSALRPIIRILKAKKIPNAVAVSVVYFTFLLFFGFLFFIVIPPIVLETSNLVRTLPGIIQQLSPEVANSFHVESLTQYIPDITNQIFSIIGGVFSNLIFVVSTLFFGFYLLLEEDIVTKFILHFFEEKKAKAITTALNKSERQMSAWFWGELTLMTVIGLMTFIGLQFIGVKYALPLAVLAGLLEVVPNIGPIIAAIPALLIASAQSPFLGLSTVALSVIIQQLENNLVVPVIMKKAVDLNPIITLIVLILGGNLGGVLGLLLSIPAYLLIEAFVREFWTGRKIAENLR